jgi:hypothetical protein
MARLSGCFTGPPRRLATSGASNGLGATILITLFVTNGLRQDERRRAELAVKLRAALSVTATSQRRATASLRDSVPVVGINCIGGGT